MARKKSSEPVRDDRSGNRHKPGFTVRLPMTYADPVDAIKDRDGKTDRSEVVREAVVDYLKRQGVWPGAQKPS